jgi:hypothetical protein
VVSTNGTVVSVTWYGGAGRRVVGVALVVVGAAVVDGAAAVVGVGAEVVGGRPVMVGDVVVTTTGAVVGEVALTVREVLAWLAPWAALPHPASPTTLSHHSRRVTIGGNGSAPAEDAETGPQEA